MWSPDDLPLPHLEPAKVHSSGHLPADTTEVAFSPGEASGLLASGNLPFNLEVVPFIALLSILSDECLGTGRGGGLGASLNASHLWTWRAGLGSRLHCLPSTQSPFLLLDRTLILFWSLFIPTQPHVSREADRPPGLGRKG